MIGAIFDKVLGGVGLAGGLAQSIIGGVKSAKAAKAQKKLIQAQRNKNDAWYNKNYYQDYLNRSDSQAAIRRVEDFMKKRNKNAAATATVMGSTPEVTAAQQQNDQKLMADTMGNIAAQATMYKNNVENAYLERDGNLANAKMGQLQADEKGAADLANSGMKATMNSAMGLVNGLMNKPPKPEQDPMDPLPTTPTPQLKVERRPFPNKFGE